MYMHAGFTYDCHHTAGTIADCEPSRNFFKTERHASSNNTATVLQIILPMENEVYKTYILLLDVQ